MSVDYSVTLGVGKYFREKHEAEEFLQQNLNLTEEQLEEMDDDFGAFQYDFIETDCMNLYSGDHWFVGVPLYQSGSPQEFIEDTQKSLKQWEEVFPSIEAEIICEVKVY